MAFLTQVAAQVPVWPGPHAAARIRPPLRPPPPGARVWSPHIRSTPGWTLTDHADRLDERHHHGAWTPMWNSPSTCHQHSHRPATATTAGGNAPRPGLRRPRRRLHCRHRPAHRRVPPTPPRRNHLLQDATSAGARSTTWSAPTPPAGPATKTCTRTPRRLTACSDYNSPPLPRDEHSASSGGTLPTSHRLSSDPTPILTDLDTARAWLDTERRPWWPSPPHRHHGWPPTPRDCPPPCSATSTVRTSLTHVPRTWGPGRPRPRPPRRPPNQRPERQPTH